MNAHSKEACIFFVDDEADMRKIVRIMLEEKFNCYVKCFDNPHLCLEALKNPQRECHLLITDVNMPNMDGITLLKEAKRLRPWLSVLIVTGFGNIPTAVSALKSGAMDFIEKPLDSTVIFPLIESALDRSFKADEMAGKLLTDSEREILKLMVEGKSNCEIAALLHRSIRTVERHRYSLMHKLNVSNQIELAKITVALRLTSPGVL
jgi:two-component system response regulator TtrR